MRLIPYITLNGNAAEAVEFYTGVFGAANKGVMRFGDTPSNSGYFGVRPTQW